jgi:replicative DNA helicase
MKRSEAKVTAPTTDTINIAHDVVNEQVVIAAAMANDALRDKLVGQLQTDTFLVPLHRTIWTAFHEMSRKKLAYDPATLQQLLGTGFDMSFLVQLQDARPDVPENIAYHTECMKWDHARFKSLVGPVAQLLEGLKNNQTDPARIRGLAKQVAGSFDGYADRQFLRNGEELVREQMLDLRARMTGRSTFPCGIEGLDNYEAGHPKAGQPRLIPGFKPGKITVVVGVPGGGKSLFSAKMIGGFARQKKKVLVGAWEASPGEVLELVACQELGISRNEASTGTINNYELARLESKMTELTEYVGFVDIPFNRNAGDKKSNDANLDLIQGYVADSGCEIFLCDLFKRALRYVQPDDEEQALIRMQAMMAELNVHGILVHQGRSKDLEARADKRPTREGIKGSSAWVEVPDTILGVHRPGLWKAIPDDHLDIIILKQRFGVWPLQIQFTCDVSTGYIGCGTTIDYHKGEDLASGVKDPEADFLADDPVQEKRQWKKR